jgi:hypothetical protein
LNISELYYTSGPDRFNTLTNLAYFIAHALTQRFPNGGGGLFHPASSVAQTQVADLAPTPSVQTIHYHMSRLYMVRYHSLHVLFLLLTGYFKAFVAVLNIFTRKFRIPASLTITTSGRASPPFKLTHVGQRPLLSVLNGDIFLRKLVHYRERGYVLSGDFCGMPVIGKLLCSQPGIDLVKAEFNTYRKLYALQGSVIPTCLGLYEVEHLGHLLLLEDCGRSINSFDELTMVQRFVSCHLNITLPLPTHRKTLANHLSSIHRSGVCHNDIAPRNVVLSGSKRISIVDFELSNSEHTCSPSLCNELTDIRHVLGIWFEGVPLAFLSGFS